MLMTSFILCSTRMTVRPWAIAPDQLDRGVSLLWSHPGRRLVKKKEARLLPKAIASSRRRRSPYESSPAGHFALAELHYVQNPFRRFRERASIAGRRPRI